MSSLLPCPFCGGDPETDHQQAFRWLQGGKLDHAAAIYCTTCNANMTICRGDTTELSDEERMIILVENWNRRATLKPEGEQISGEAVERAKGVIMLNGMKAKDQLYDEEIVAILEAAIGIKL